MLRTEGGGEGGYCDTTNVLYIWYIYSTPLYARSMSFISRLWFCYYKLCLCRSRLSLTSAVASFGTVRVIRNGRVGWRVEWERAIIYYAVVGRPRMMEKNGTSHRHHLISICTIRENTQTLGMNYHSIGSGVLRVSNTYAQCTRRPEFRLISEYIICHCRCKHRKRCKDIFFLCGSIPKLRREKHSEH